MARSKPYKSNLKFKADASYVLYSSKYNEIAQVRYNTSDNTISVISPDYAEILGSLEAMNKAMFEILCEPHVILLGEL